MRTGLTSVGINGRGANSDCATVPTYEKLQPAIRNPPRFEGKPTSPRSSQTERSSYSPPPNASSKKASRCNSSNKKR